MAQGALDRAKDLFLERYGEMPEFCGIAPGRVNLIGEHTDYCDGFVFPMALEKSTVVVGRKRKDGVPRATFFADPFPEDTVEFDITDNIGRGDPAWSNYARGMVAIYKENGFQIPGFDAVVATTVPLGGGVSSSASFEMAIGVFLEALCGRSVAPEVRAKWGQKCEHTYVGLMCGIMDQMISSKGLEGHAVLIDCRSLECEAVPMNDPELCVLICNSNVKHSLTGSEYPTRVKQCATVTERLGISSLRDGTMVRASQRRNEKEALNKVKDSLDDEVFRRGRHVISENDRVMAAKDALLSHDYDAFGRLMKESHVSLRDDYEVSIPEIDFLVDTANAFEGVYGSRITGGGFGGCTVTLVKASVAEKLQEQLRTSYKEKFSKEALTFITRPGEGARSCSI